MYSVLCVALFIVSVKEYIGVERMVRANRLDTRCRHDLAYVPTFTLFNLAQ